MNEPENIDFGRNFADWQGGAAFNTYWQYSYVNRAAFYANISGQYRQFMVRFVENWLWWYDGWVPYFHNNAQGIFATKVGTALVDGAAKKVIGGRIFYKNKNRESTNIESDKSGYEINKSLSFISSSWADKSGFPKMIKLVAKYAAAAGTSLLKLDRANGELIPSALRFDSFYPVVGTGGKLIEVYCFLRNFTKLSSFGKEQHTSSYYVVEHRYFGDYERLNGEVLKNVPLITYEIRKATGTVTTGQDYNAQGEKIEFKSLPKSVRRDVGRAYNGIEFERPILLPFANHLGAVLVTWTDGVSALPELPFGESLLSNILPFLQSYDYYFSAFNTDMYLGRGRVLVPKMMQSAKASEKNRNDYNEGLDRMMYTKYQSTNPDEANPVPIQFDLRSTSWAEIRTMLIQNIAINTGLNVGTIASFLQDSNAARTAREISTEESETALFVDDKREILERPLNEVLKIVLRYYGYVDDVVIRWSGAGLSNRYALTDMLATAVSSGFCSKKKAMQMFNFDDDEYQLREEYANIKEEQASAEPLFDDQNYFGGVNDDSEQTTKPSGDSHRGSGDEDPDDGQK